MCTLCRRPQQSHRRRWRTSGRAHVACRAPSATRHIYLFCKFDHAILHNDVVITIYIQVQRFLLVCSPSGCSSCPALLLLLCCSYCHCCCWCAALVAVVLLPVSLLLLSLLLLLILLLYCSYSVCWFRAVAALLLSVRAVQCAGCGQWQTAAPDAATPCVALRSAFAEWQIELSSQYEAESLCSVLDQLSLQPTKVLPLDSTPTDWLNL